MLSILHQCTCLHALLPLLSISFCFYLNQNITQVYPNRKEILRKYAPAIKLLILKNLKYKNIIEST